MRERLSFNTLAQRRPTNYKKNRNGLHDSISKMVGKRPLHETGTHERIWYPDQPPNKGSMNLLELAQNCVVGIKIPLKIN